VIALVVDAACPDADVIARAADLLRQGGVVAYPTDTLYGLAADPSSQRAVEELYRIKGRPVDQAIPLVAADLAQVEQCAGPLSHAAHRLGACLWPGPLTMIVPAWAGLAAALHGGTGTVAIRVPAHPVACALARAFGAPITSTSANRSGRPATSSPDVVRESMGNDLVAILDAGPSPGGLPSTIIDVLGERPRLVRPGAVPFERVLECLQ
jgi:L-threonylcarbamoyladenylate synthase